MVEEKFRYYIIFSHVHEGLVLHGYRFERLDHSIEDEETIERLVDTISRDQDLRNVTLLDWKRIQ